MKSNGKYVFSFIYYPLWCLTAEAQNFIILNMSRDFSVCPRHPKLGPSGPQSLRTPSPVLAFGSPKESQYLAFSGFYETSKLKT